MKYKLKVYTIWELGVRSNQEDAMFPRHGKACDNDRTFILCDGMGGHSAGEVASQAVCEAMGAWITGHCPDAEGDFSDADFEGALAAAFDLLDERDDGSAKKMGTTMTFLKLHAKGATIAHIGDSRVYHIRPGGVAENTEILFQTRDHSLVNDLIRAKELSLEEAKNFPQRNVITRAMQPHMERRSRADVYHTDDIRAGDYFMLCTDGMLEQMEDENLKFIFSDEGGDAAHKSDMLVKVTAHNRDNHSAIVVEVVDVEEAANTAISEEERLARLEMPEGRKAEEEHVVVSGEKQESVVWKQLPRKKSFCGGYAWRIVVVGVIVVLVVLGGYVVYKRWFAKGVDTEQVPSKEKCPSSKFVREKTGADKEQLWEDGKLIKNME